MKLPALYTGTGPRLALRPRAWSFSPTPGLPGSQADDPAPAQSLQSDSAPWTPRAGGHRAARAAARGAPKEPIKASKPGTLTGLMCSWRMFVFDRGCHWTGPGFGGPSMPPEKAPRIQVLKRSLRKDLLRRWTSRSSLRMHDWKTCHGHVFWDHQVTDLICRGVGRF